MGNVILTGIGLGIGLAMDAFAVSMSNGLKENKMKLKKILLIAITFGVFQGVMPLIGYLVGFSLIEYIDKFVPWIALTLLSFLGIKMIIDGIKEIKEGNKDDEVTPCESCLSTKVLLVQAVATSIDALSAGLSFSNYNIYEALIVVGFIAVLTTIICIAGVYIGKKFGTKLSKYAAFIGGSILIIIGLEIFLTGILA